LFSQSADRPCGSQAAGSDPADPHRFVLARAIQFSKNRPHPPSCRPLSRPPLGEPSNATWNGSPCQAPNDPPFTRAASRLERRPRSLSVRVGRRASSRGDRPPVQAVDRSVSPRANRRTYYATDPSARCQAPGAGSASTR